ncbi:homologous-pairing protein 2 homolog [Exaiptasia diaphana]|uniref:Homologous-pairing protein 2 homolog n=1 Tax=Exaiptasia diaphana TaxID=2652724 RepID=A0A913YA71_EXADI|nr:homologous-pairing protein 2 homolog [Exaiptasia diaphana]KXJ19595.1 Homologous-pairing protein 2-like [Exaiptasia diaphana]
MSKKKDSDAEEAVLSYLNKNNRPYSAVDIFTNLHKEYGKTAVQRSLENLSSQQKIHEKIYGKQKVYAPLQDKFGDYDEEKVKQLDTQITELQTKLKTLQETFKSNEAELKRLNSSLTTEEATARLKEFNSKCEVYEKRLSKIKSADNHVTPEIKDKIYKNHKTAVDFWRKRKRMCTDIVNSILENYPKSKKQLMEDIGLETDEEYNAVLPKK